MTKSSKIALGEGALTFIVSLIAIFAAYNLYSAARYGLIYCGPRGHASWQTFQNNSIQFIIATGVYMVALATLPVAIYFRARETRRAGQNIEKRLNKPKFDDESLRRNEDER